MPEAVSEYIETKNLNEVRSIQQKILMGYENDFAKHLYVSKLVGHNL